MYAKCSNNAKPSFFVEKNLPFAQFHPSFPDNIIRYDGDSLQTKSTLNEKIQRSKVTSNGEATAEGRNKFVKKNYRL